jgi:hypothetical protein
MSGSRWVVGIGALLVAFVALYVLLRVGNEHAVERVPEQTQPALDEIDDASRKAMRELLREDASEG